MNRHRDDVALVMDSADFRRDSHVRARTPGLAADLENVIVRPTILLHDRRYERRVEAAAGALAMQAAKLHALLAEPLTRPLGSMQAPRCFAGDEAITLIQNKAVGAAPPHLPADGRHARELASVRRAEVTSEKACTDNHLRQVAPPASVRESGAGGDFHHYKEQPTPMREARPADDQYRRAAQPALARAGRLGAEFLHQAAQPRRDAQRAEHHPRHTAVTGGDRLYAPGDDDHARYAAPSVFMSELEPGGGRHDAAHPAPMRDGPRDGEYLRHVMPPAPMREAGSGGGRHSSAHPAPMRDGPRDSEHLRHVMPPAPMREAGSGGGRHSSAHPAPMRDGPRDGEYLRHVMPPAPMREAGSGGGRHYAAHPTSLRDQSHHACEAALGGDRHHYAAQVTPMCEELPTDNRLRYGEPPTSMRDAALSQNEPDADAGSYHGLRHVREYAHARLESLEAAAISSKTAAARPHNAARARSNAAVESARRQPSADHSGNPRSSTGTRRRSEGLTDARNALRRAYAESKLRLPDAPPRSSARSAGVVDGWERLPAKRAKRARSRRKGARVMWPWAAALAVSSMFFAYTLTLTVVPEPKLARPPQPIASETASRAPTLPPAPTDLPPAAEPTAIARPRATGTKPPKPPTRTITRSECRDQTPRSN